MDEESEGEVFLILVGKIGKKLLTSVQVQEEVYDVSAIDVSTESVCVTEVNWVGVYANVLTGFGCLPRRIPY